MFYIDIPIFFTDIAIDILQSVVEYTSAPGIPRLPSVLLTVYPGLACRAALWRRRVLSCGLVVFPSGL